MVLFHAKEEGKFCLHDGSCMSIDEAFTLRVQLEEVTTAVGGAKSASVWGEKCTPALFKFRAYTLPQLLETHSTKIGGLTDMVLWQCIVERLFKEQIDKRVSSQQAQVSLRTRLTPTDLETNAVRYAAGFVVRKLLQKYSTKKSSKAYEFVDCLEGMKNTEMDDMEPSLRKSKRWIETTDRGGLCHINNCAYRLFESIECACYPLLMDNFDNLAQHSVQAIALTTAEDTDVQHLWSTVAMDTLDDKELLVEMIEEWVNMRGHSIRSKTLNDYKKLKREKKKSGKKALRKELKRATITVSEGK